MRDRIARAVRWHVIALLLYAVPAAADEDNDSPNHRDGFWATIGGGYSVMRATCSQCSEDPPYNGQPAFYLEMGGVVTPRVLVAGEIFTDSPDIAENATRITHYTANAHWYPLSFPFFLRIGFGLSRGRNRFEVDGVEQKELATGLGVMWGLGADIHLSRTLSLSPMASWYLMAVGDFATSAGTARSVSANTWFAGIGITLN